MKKLLLITLLMGWFFGLRIPHPQTEGAVINILIGPFKNEIACKAELAYAVDYFSTHIGEPSKVYECSTKVEL